MTQFIPFPNIPQSTNIESLVIECDESKIVIHGDIEIGKDQSGLANAQKLLAVLSKVVDELKSSELPPTLKPGTNPPETIDNPFT